MMQSNNAAVLTRTAIRHFVDRVSSSNFVDEKWEARWLQSSLFLLCNVWADDINQPVPIGSPVTVVEKMANIQTAWAWMEPIVIDIVPPKMASELTGSTMVVDGKHRLEVCRAIGQHRIYAWVGDRAVQFFPRLNTLSL